MKKRTWLLILAALALTAAIGGSLAWLQDQSQTAQNRLIPGRVPNEVEEELEGNVKNNVTITNTGSVDAYIRAAVTVTWVDEAGNVSGEQPAAGTDFTWDLTLDGWKQGADGYYYHLAPIAPGASTGVLFTSCQSAAEKKGFRLSVEVMGQSLQALGREGETPVVVQTWDSVLGIRPDAALSIKEASA